MDNKKLIEYVRDSRRQGMSNIQIAQHLGMNVEEMTRAINEGELPATKGPEVRPVEKPVKKPVKSVEKPVSGAPSYSSSVAAEKKPVAPAPAESKDHPSWMDE